MKIRLLACADVANLDMNSGRASLFNIVDVMAVAAVPYLIPQISILTIADSEKGESDRPNDIFMKIIVGSQEIPAIKMALDFTNSGKCRNIISLQGLVIQEPGNIVFSLRKKEKEMARYEVFVTLVSKPQVSSGLRAKPRLPPKKSTGRVRKTATKIKSSSPKS